MPGPEEIGNLNITVGVDIESAKAGLQSVKAEMESVGPTADGVSQQTQDAISRVIGRLDDIISILDGVEEKTKSVTDFSKRAWGTAADAVNPYISSIEDLEDVTTDAAKASEKTGGSINAVFGKVGETLEKSTSGVRKFVGSLSSVAGVATGLISVFGLVSGAVLGFKSILESIGGDGDKDKPLPKVGELLEDLANKARGVDDALQNSPGYVQTLSRIKEAKEELTALNAELARSTTPRGVGPGERSISLGRQEYEVRLDIENTKRKIVELEQQSNDILKTAIDKREEAKKQEQDALDIAKKRAASLESLGKIAEGLSISLLPEDEQIRANAELQIEQLKRIAKEGGIDSDDFILRAAITAVEEIREKNLEAIREQERIKDEAQRARDAESAAKQIESAQRAAEAFARGLDGIFGADFTTRLDNLTAAVRDGNNAIRRLK